MKRMLIDDTQPEETRVVIVDGNKVEDVEFESSFRKQLKGNIFTAKVIRIEPSLQAAFVDYGGNRHGFLAFGEIHPDYYNISDEFRAEVEKEVDEIIERKRQYQAERKAERERRKLEREQKRAEYEAKKLAEAEALAKAEAEEENAEVTDGCGCSENCACRAEDGHCHCQETGVCTCSEECHCCEHKEENAEAENALVETNVEETDTTDEKATAELTVEAENAPVENENSFTETEVAPAADTDTTNLETTDSPVEAETAEEAADEAESEKKTERRPRRRGNRFLGRRSQSKGKYKVSADASGLANAEIISEEVSETEVPEEPNDTEKDEDEEFINTNSKEFDNDEEDSDSEHYLEIQRKLILARKLYHRSTIQDVIKEGQTLLIQIVKEERGNKGAACTTYLSLAGRYCVLMPNRIKSGGVSRKITSAADRKRLKDIMHELPLNDDMSLIIRTAGEDKKRSDIIRDYNYLIRTWNHIRHSALNANVPALIYEEGNLIKRALRDMYTKDIAEVIIDGDNAFRTAKEFCKILSPNLSRKIKCRKPNEIPVFQHYQVEKELDKLHNPIVQLESGGYLVINPTEALVSIDVNSGRATHEMDIEETALKTNLEAADEIAKQLRMRNLAGLVVVDFIDMDEPANNHAVEKRMKEAMKPDRARVQIAKMSIFGLLEISRQRMHSSFVESNYVTCPYCRGQGVQRTTESSCTLILRALEEEGIKGNFNRLEVKLPPELATYILNHKRRILADLEEKYGLEIIISADSSIKNICDYRIEKNRLPKAKAEATAAASAYAESNVSHDCCCDDEDDEAETSTEETENNNGGSNNRNRRKKFDRRRNRNNGRRNRRNEETNNAVNNESVPPAPKAEAVEPAAAPKEKKTWWKKLIG